MADVAADLKSWSTTASSNSPSDSTTVGGGLADNLQEIQKVVRQDLAHKGADIASATTPDIGAVAGLLHDITGTTTITGLGTVSAGIWKMLQFDGALTLTHNASSLILPGGQNITTAAGDVGIFFSEGSGNWRCISYTGKNVYGAKGTFTSLAAGSDDSGAIGASGTAFSDLFLASGAVINFNAGDITLTHGSNYLNFAGGNLFIGDTANGSQTLGMTINQGANDDEILAFKSSDIAHGVTSVTETDTFGSIKKHSATLGGWRFHAMAEDDASANTVISMQAYGGQAGTAKTTAALGLIAFSAYEHNGLGTLANITADGNVFTVSALVGGSTVCRFLVDEDGDMYSVTAGQTFDEHDDLALVNRYDIVRRDSLRQNYAEFAQDYEDELIRLGVLGGRVADGGMTNVCQLQRLHNGAIRQLSERVEILVAENAALVQRMNLLEGPRA